MPIWKTIPAPKKIRPNHRALHDVLGHESNRVHHEGSCPLKGQTTRTGRMPFCTDACVGPTPPIYQESTFEGLVLGVGESEATVWDFLTKAPKTIPLCTTGLVPDEAIPDATPGIMDLYTEWSTWRTLEHEVRSQKEQAALEAKKRAEEERRRAEEERRRAAELLRVQEENQKIQNDIRRLQSRLRVGSKVQVVADPPGFTERNQRSKPRNRKPSLIGHTTQIVSIGAAGGVYICGPDNTTIFVHPSQVRVVLPDGTLGDPN